MLRGLLERSPDLPVLMLTGRDDPAARRACEQAGAAGFLAKPLVVADLRAEVQELLERGAA